LGQVNNVFLIVAITAVMAIVTAVLAFFVDVIAPVFTGNTTQTAGDAVAIAVPKASGH
jgi:hypothetical protein